MCVIDNDQCSPPGGRMRRKMCQVHYGRVARYGDPHKRLREPHGMTGTCEHKAWKALIQRCTNPNDAHFADYGGRGIKVCDRWRNSFLAFLEDMGPRPEWATGGIDRRDVNGNYEPGNCRWADWSTQVRNRRKRKRASSPFIGVSWNKAKGKWVAYIKIAGAQCYLGRFDSEEEAAHTRDQYLIDNALDAPLNFPHELTKVRKSK